MSEPVVRSAAIEPLASRIPRRGRRGTADSGIWFHGWLALAGLLVAGCGDSGPRRYEASGSVTVAGEKVAEGAIAFVPIGDTKGPQAGTNIHEGRYRIDRGGGPIAGRHRVEITSLRKTGRQVPNMGGQLFDQKANVLPERYSGDTSELVVEIRPHGTNEFDFDLEAR